MARLATSTRFAAGRSGPLPTSGFTLVEVLIALAITVLVGTIAYTSLTAAMAGVEGTRAAADRSHQVARAWMIISRDIRQISMRGVRDEFGQNEPALLGGRSARFALSLTRAGWDNSQQLGRSTLQRVNYLLQDNALWRESYPVLDRAPDTQPQRLRLLDDVEFLEVAFLDRLDKVRSVSAEAGLDTESWRENWLPDPSRPGSDPGVPVALEVRLQLPDWGEIRRLYTMPPL